MFSSDLEKGFKGMFASSTTKPRGSTSKGHAIPKKPEVVDAGVNGGAHGDHDTKSSITPSMTEDVQDEDMTVPFNFENARLTTLPCNRFVAGVQRKVRWPVDIAKGQDDDSKAEDEDKKKEEGQTGTSANNESRGDNAEVKDDGEGKTEAKTTGKVVGEGNKDEDKETCKDAYEKISKDINKKTSVVELLEMIESSPQIIPDSSRERAKRYEDVVKAVTGSKRRKIVRHWPRDPKGVILKDDNSHRGKRPPGQVPLWGASVLDFYFVNRIPGVSGLLTITTGSKLLGFCKENNELDYAKDEIKWAEKEPDPTEIHPYDMSTVLRQVDLAESPPPHEGVFQQFRHRIPARLLPQKLFVHDPDNTLIVDRNIRESRSSNSDPIEFNLELTTSEKERVESIRKTIDEFPPCEPESAGRLFVLIDPEMPTNKIVNVPEAIFARFPPMPILQKVDEAHLYLSLDNQLGSGNHSHVYKATWELPRSVVEPPSMCETCVKISLVKALQRRHKFIVDDSEPVGTQLLKLMKNIAIDHGRTGNVAMTYIPADVNRTYCTNSESTGNGKSVDTFVDDAECKIAYQGQMTEILLEDLEWQTAGNYCHHNPLHDKASASFKVSVAAKLSRRGDDHLSKEAKNYQEFPNHFFQHFNGYYVTPPLHNPTPASAVVPQFYGYYIPVEQGDSRGTYCSPVLLLEDCGKPISIRSLSLDEREECASLFFRLHFGGWIQGSAYERNILRDYGEIDQHPNRPGLKVKGNRRFRLIDFGRSEYVPDSKSEETSIRSMFGVAPL